MFKKPCLGRGIKGKFFYGSHRHALFRKCSEVCWAPLITFSMDGTLSASTYMGLMPLYPSPVINDHNETNTQPGQSAPLYPCLREGGSLNTAPPKGLPRVEREGVGVACKDRADNYKLPTPLSVCLTSASSLLLWRLIFTAFKKWIYRLGKWHMPITVLRRLKQEGHRSGTGTAVSNK